ncbi:MAG: hypothetical protein AYK18_04900 [Theionarchaea archaeon DG-70]|nr:MAG: hypothetical protein AYK18_04900 [Theionarchaea archaeon DG-70]
MIREGASLNRIKIEAEDTAAMAVIRAMRGDSINTVRGVHKKMWYKEFGFTSKNERSIESYKGLLNLEYAVKSS